MYEGIKRALGPTAPLKSAIGELTTDKGKQIERWVQYHTELYSRENVVTTSAINAIESLPIMEDLDAEQSLEEL